MEFSPGQHFPIQCHVCVAVAVDENKIRGASPKFSVVLTIRRHSLYPRRLVKDDWFFASTISVLQSGRCARQDAEISKLHRTTLLPAQALVFVFSSQFIELFTQMNLFIFQSFVWNMEMYFLRSRERLEC